LKANNKREPTITAAGIDNNLVGGHYDLIIMDDVVNRDNVSTMDQISKVITRYKDSLDLLEPHGEMIIIGTRWHDSDLYGWIMDPSNNALSDYEVMLKRAYEGSIMEDGDFVPLWPGKFSRENLYTKLKQEGWAHFSAQYLNDPVPEEDAIFKRSWFKYYLSDDLRGKIMNRFLLIDPAISLKKDADYTAMVVIGVDEWNNIFILDISRKRMSPGEIINEIFRLRDSYNVIDVAMEQVAFQKAIGYSLREDIRFKKRPFHITELKPNERTKDQRIKGLQPLYENQKVFHNKLLPNNIHPLWRLIPLIIIRVATWLNFFSIIQRIPNWTFKKLLKVVDVHNVASHTVSSSVGSSKTTSIFVYKKIIIFNALQITIVVIDPIFFIPINLVSFIGS